MKLCTERLNAERIQEESIPEYFRAFSFQQDLSSVSMQDLQFFEQFYEKLKGDEVLKHVEKDNKVKEELLEEFKKIK